jgi:hypothetical protein
MNKKVVIFAVGIAGVVALHYGYSVGSTGQLAPTVASGWTPPQCQYGYEPGGGPIRCANPNDPNSYLYKKAHAPQPKAGGSGYTISPDGKEIITADGRHYARRPDWMPSPQQDPGFCARETHSASDLNRCVQIQDQEFLPSAADYENALGQQSSYLYRVRRANCIDEHGTWFNGNCQRH